METISCNNAAIVPKECHKIGASSGNSSRFLLSSKRALSRCSGIDNCNTNACKESLVLDSMIVMIRKARSKVRSKLLLSLVRSGG